MSQPKSHMERVSEENRKRGRKRKHRCQREKKT